MIRVKGFLHFSQMNSYVGITLSFHIKTFNAEDYQTVLVFMVWENSLIFSYFIPAKKHSINHFYLSLIKISNTTIPNTHHIFPSKIFCI
jgi:hypothetical protein